MMNWELITNISYKYILYLTDSVETETWSFITEEECFTAEPRKDWSYDYDQQQKTFNVFLLYPLYYSQCQTCVQWFETTKLHEHLISLQQQ